MSWIDLPMAMQVIQDAIAIVGHGGQLGLRRFCGAAGFRRAAGQLIAVDVRSAPVVIELVMDRRRRPAADPSHSATTRDTTPTGQGRCVGAQCVFVGIQSLLDICERLLVAVEQGVNPLLIAEDRIAATVSPVPTISTTITSAISAVSTIPTADRADVGPAAVSGVSAAPIVIVVPVPGAIVPHGEVAIDVVVGKMVRVAASIGVQTVWVRTLCMRTACVHRTGVREMARVVSCVVSDVMADMMSRVVPGGMMRGVVRPFGQRHLAPSRRQQSAPDDSPDQSASHSLVPLLN